jgi:hypothetical protein
MCLIVISSIKQYKCNAISFSQRVGASLDAVALFAYQLSMQLRSKGNSVYSIIRIDWAFGRRLRLLRERHRT